LGIIKNYMKKIIIILTLLLLSKIGISQSQIPTLFPVTFPALPSEPVPASTVGAMGIDTPSGKVVRMPLFLLDSTGAYFMGRNGIVRYDSALKHFVMENLYDSILVHTNNFTNFDTLSGTAIGIVPANTNYYLQTINPNFTFTNNTSSGIALNINPSASGANPGSALQGIIVNVNDQMTGLLSNEFAINAILRIGNTGNVTTQSVYQGSLNASSTGAATGQSNVFDAISPSVSGGATLAAVTGVFINPQKVAGVTHGYGIVQLGASDIDSIAGLVKLLNVGIPPAGYKVLVRSIFPDSGIYFVLPTTFATSASNGLTFTSGNITLGGTLTSNTTTTIAGNGTQELVFTNMSPGTNSGFQVQLTSNGSDAGWDMFEKDSVTGFWTRIPKGTYHQILQMGASGPAWASASSGGTQTLAQTLTNGNIANYGQPYLVTTFTGATDTSFNVYGNGRLALFNGAEWLDSAGNAGFKDTVFQKTPEVLYSNGGLYFQNPNLSVTKVLYQSGNGTTTIGDNLAQVTMSGSILLATDSSYNIGNSSASLNKLYLKSPPAGGTDSYTLLVKDNTLGYVATIPATTFAPFAGVTGNWSVGGNTTSDNYVGSGTMGFSTGGLGGTTTGVGNNVDGTITWVAPTVTATGGSFAIMVPSVNFSTSTPRIILTAVNSNAAAQTVYVGGANATSFTVYIPTSTITSGTTFIWNYAVVQ
jgi:hypothetical protein